MINNIIKDVETNCKDKSVKGIVRFLFESGDFSIASEFDREIYFFYKELINQNNYTHREARSVTIEVFKLSDSKFKRVTRKYRERPKN